MTMIEAEILQVPAGALPRIRPDREPAPRRRPRPGDRLRIAMVGQRGVPATYGGVERHVEELGARLVALGHEVTVYCRTSYGEEHPAEHRGMLLRHLPALPSKHLEAISHSGLATLAALGHHDVIHYHALGPGLAAPLPRLFGRARVVLTVHGLDDERAKWGWGARSVLRTARWMSARVPHATIAVSRALADHYANHPGHSAVYIPNGVTTPTRRPPEAVRRLGLEPGRYLLFVGRFVPEKAPDLLLRAFRRLDRPVRLVLAGGSSHTDAYAAELERLAADDPRVVLPGYVYGEALEALYDHAGAFVLPSALEGLPLTLLEAASHGTPVVASDIPPHVEVLGIDRPGGHLFPSGQEAALTIALERALADPGAERAGAVRLRNRVLAAYSWDRAARATEAVYRIVLGQLDRVVDLRSEEAADEEEVAVA
jgi:glycosyltransferase involved in cell wall biosynthesis